MELRSKGSSLQGGSHSAWTCQGQGHVETSPSCSHLFCGHLGSFGQWEVRRGGDKGRCWC